MMLKWVVSPCGQKPCKIPSTWVRLLYQQIGGNGADAQAQEAESILPLPSFDENQQHVFVHRNPFWRPTSVHAVGGKKAAAAVDSRFSR